MSAAKNSSSTALPKPVTASAGCNDPTAPPEAAAKILDVVPLKRFGEAADIANITAYLCAEEAGYITGQVFNVDGGMAM